MVTFTRWKNECRDNDWRFHKFAVDLDAKMEDEVEEDEDEDEEEEDEEVEEEEIDCWSDNNTKGQTTSKIFR